MRSSWGTRRRSTRRVGRWRATPSWSRASSASARPSARSTTTVAGARSGTPRPGRACNRTSSASSKEMAEMAERCAVVGVGQTHHTKVRDDVSLAGLLREAGQRALEDAEMTWRDIDAVVIGTAPDSFEGVMMPELYLADALGAAGKPIMRVHTAGSVGGATPGGAGHLPACRRRRRGLGPRLS